MQKPPSFWRLLKNHDGRCRSEPALAIQNLLPAILTLDPSLFVIPTPNAALPFCHSDAERSEAEESLHFFVFKYRVAEFASS